MYDGGLARLEGKDAAIVSFLTNRMAKLKLIGDPEIPVRNFDKKRFESLVEQTDEFVTHLFSEENIDHLLEANTKKFDNAEEALWDLDDPDVENYLELSDKMDASNKSLENLSEDFYDLVQKEITHLESAASLFETNYSDSEEDADHLRKMANELKKLTPEMAVEVFVKVKDYYHRGMLTTILEKVSNDSEYSIRERSAEVSQCLYHVMHNLQFLRDERITERDREEKAGHQKHLDAKGKKSVKKLTFDEWVAKNRKDTPSTIENKDDEFFETGKVLSHAVADDSHLWGKRRIVVEEKQTLQKGLFKTREVILEKGGEESDVLTKYFALNREHRHLTSMRANIEGLLSYYNRSHDAVLSDMRKEGIADLYFAKTLLIASDLRSKDATSNPERKLYGFTRLISWKHQPIQSHSFVELSADKRFNHDLDENITVNHKYSDVHFVASHLPFAEVVVDYLRHKHGQIHVE